MVAAAVVGSAVVGAAASTYSGNKAASAQDKASRRASDTELEMFYQNREDFAPYREVGAGALGQLANLYGIQTRDQQVAGGTEPMSMDQFAQSDMFTPQENVKVGVAKYGPVMRLQGPTLEEQYQEYTDNFQPASTPAATSAAGTPDFSAFTNSPDYQFAFDQGNRAVNQMLAKRGLTESGPEKKALTRFGQGLASQQYGNYVNRLASMAGIGQSATSQLGQMGQQVAANVGANQRAAGDARASAYLNQGAAMNNVADSYGQYRLLQVGGYI